VGAVAVVRKFWIERDWKLRSVTTDDSALFLGAELWLCILWVVGEAVHISRAHPTFARYYMLCVPGMTVLATSGLVLTGQRIWRSTRPWATAAPVIALLVLGLGQTLLADDDGIRWRDFDDIAKKVQELFPANVRMLADEQVYFLTKRTPPEGFEHEDSHKLNLPDNQMKRLHIINKEVLKKQLQTGKFDVVVSCDDDEEIYDLKLPDIFGKSTEAGSCNIFWEPTGSASSPSPVNPKAESPKTAKAKNNPGG
jgi:hypothetical protein